jgi:hypothetical protein
MTTTRLIARFPNTRAADEAARSVEHEAMSVEPVAKVATPNEGSKFDLRRLKWAAVGVALGAFGGGVAGALLGSLLNMEQGMLVQGPMGVALSGGGIGAILLGMLGLLFGLAVAEPKATAEVAEDRSPNDSPEEVVLHLDVAEGQQDLAREALTDAGATAVRHAGAATPAAPPA